MPEEKVSTKWVSSCTLADYPHNCPRDGGGHLSPPAADAGPRQPSEVINEWISMLEHPDFGAVPSKKSMIDILRTIKQIITTNPPVPQEAAPRECDCEECASRLATAPDEAMRVARQIVNLPISDMRVGGEQAVERVAALIREAGSEREREAFKSCAKELREHYNSDWDSTVPGAEFDAEILRILRKHLASRLLGGKSK